MHVFAFCPNSVVDHKLKFLADNVDKELPSTVTKMLSRTGASLNVLGLDRHRPANYLPISFIKLNKSN